MKKRFLTLLGGALLGLFSMNVSAEATWTDVTEKITNPSFESDEGSSNLESTTTNVTGWTKTQGTPSNSQWGVAKSSCTIQAIATSMPTSDEGNYYYIRCNWNADVHYGISQSIAELPAGMYKLSYKAATNSSNWGKSTHTVSLIESDGATSTKTMYSTGANWTDFETWIFKTSGESTLTIKVDMLAGEANGGQHYQLLVDDFKLFYCEDLGATASNPVDVTAFISNPAINNTNKGYVPRGWTAGNRSVGNSNYTENTGNTQLEAWSGNNMYFDYYQTLSGLPNGAYTLSANCHDSNSKGGKLYATAGSTTKDVAMTADYSTITTEKITVSDGSLRIGIKSATTSGGSWMTGDDFVLTFLGYDATEALAALAEQIEAAEFTGKHSTASETALQTAIAAAQAFVDAGEGTKAEIETASSNLAVAVAAVNTSIADYAALHAAIAAANYAVITPSYTALATEITTAQGIYNNGTAESCADAIATLDAAVKVAKVADYSYVADNFQYGVELGTWTKDGPTGELNNQHWSGEARPYMEQSSAAWGWSAWSITYDQDVTLPAGDYVFKAAGRKAAGNGCTLQLVVTNKATSAVIGTVSDFPEGDVGLGINKAGATSFDPTDAAGFANNGAGRGFQWRFVKFTLTESTTINVAVSAEATTNHQWVSFCDATVQTNNAANIAMIAYNVALNNAKAAIDNDDYKNVTGAEKTALQGLIDADMTGKTGAEIETATSALTTATTAFTEAAPAYDAFANILAKVENLDDAGKASFNTDMAGVLAAYEANTCSASDLTDADAQAAFVAAIKAQGAGSDWTGLIVNPSFEDTTGTLPNGWTTEKNTTGSFDYKLLEETLNTNGTTDGKYVLNAWAPQINYIYVKQSVTLPAGVYELSGAVYSDRVSDQHVEAIANGIKYKSAPVSNNNWEKLSTEFIVSSESDVTIGIFSNGKNLSGNTDGWFRADNFKLKYVGPVSSANMTITDVKWGTFVAPFDVTIPQGVEAYTVTGVTGGTISMESVETTIIANTPVLVYSESAQNETFYGKAVSGDPATDYLVGVYEPTKATAGSYILMLHEGKAVFGKVVENDEPTVGANRCYLNVPGGTSSTILRFGDATGIQSVEQQAETVIYDLTGRRVDAAVKGIYIVNGKKMLVK